MTTLVRLGVAVLSLTVLLPQPCHCAASRLSQKVSLKLEGRPLRELLDKVGAKCRLPVVADKSVLDRPITVVADKAPAWRLLNAAAEQASIFWYPDGNALLVASRGSDTRKTKGKNAFVGTDLAAQALVAFGTSLNDYQKKVFLQGNVLAWKSLRASQRELIINIVKRLRPWGVPRWIGDERNRRLGVREGVGIIFDPYVECRLQGKLLKRLFFRLDGALTALMSVKPLENEGAFAATAPLARRADRPPVLSPRGVKAPRLLDGAERARAAREYTLARLCREAFPKTASPLPLPPFGRRVVTVLGPAAHGDMKWLLDRAKNCLGARERAHGDTKVLSIPSFRLREGWKSELQFAPLVGIPRFAVTQMLRPFIDKVDLEAEGCPFSTADFLRNASFKWNEIGAAKQKFVSTRLPKQEASKLRRSMEEGQVSIQLGTSTLLVVFAYRKDHVTSGPLRATWVCTVQVQADYGESLPQVVTRRRREDN